MKLLIFLRASDKKPKQDKKFLTLSWRRPLSYRSQSIDLLCKSMDWFLYNSGLRHERVKGKSFLFLFLEDTPLANYANDNTPYCTGLKILDVLIKLENLAKILLQWFKDSRIKANPDKYHLLINNTKESFQIKIGNETVSNGKCEKLLGVNVDHELNFNEHVLLLCKKASQKLNCLSRIASCMTFDQRRLILNSFIISHFSYCPIVRMFHSRKLNERINHIHEKALRIVYKNFNSPFQELLIENDSLKIYHRGLQKLVTDIFKIKNGSSPELMNAVFDVYRRLIRRLNDVVYLLGKWTLNGVSF